MLTSLPFTPTITESDQSTILEGWLHKQSFNIDKGERSSIATRMAGYKKRWFVLRADGLHFFEQQSQPPPAVIGSYDYQAQQAQTALGGIAVQEMESVGVSTAPNAPDTELEITCAHPAPAPAPAHCLCKMLLLVHE